VCPEGIGKDSVVYSVGVGTDVTFDLALIARFGVTVHAFDPTPVSVAWVRAQALPPAFRLHEIGVAEFDGARAFYPPRTADSSHFSPIQRFRQTSATPPVQAPVRRLRTILRDLGHTGIDLLKMDIEGGEYAVIENIVRDEVPVRQLLVEFHHGYPRLPLARTIEAVRRLRGAGYRIFHISDRTYEMSFLHRPPGTPESYARR